MRSPKTFKYHIFASTRLRAWHPVHRFQNARPCCRVARRVWVRAIAAGQSFFHGRQFLRIGTIAVASRSMMAVRPRCASWPLSAVTVPISLRSGIWSRRSGRTGLSPSLPGVNYTAKMSEGVLYMGISTLRHQRRPWTPCLRACHSPPSRNLVPVLSISRCSRSSAHRQGIGTAGVFCRRQGSFCLARA